MRGWWLPVLLLLAGLGAAGAAVSTMAGDPAAAHEPGAAAADPVEREARLAARAERREKRRTVRAARVRPERPDPKLDDAARAELRTTTRDDQLEGLLSRIEEHADAAGWSESELAAVEEILASTTQSITDQLAQVDAGEASWEEVKAGVRDERLQSADRVRELLGDARFEALAHDVGLERFLGEEPIRGRLSADRPAGGPRNQK